LLDSLLQEEKMQLFCFLFLVMSLGSGLAQEDRSYSKIVTKPNGETEGDIFVDLPAQSYYKIKFTVRAPKHLDPEPSYRRNNNVEHKSRQLPTPSEAVETPPQSVEAAANIGETANAYNDEIVKERKIVERSTVAPQQGEASERPISYRYRILPSKLKAQGHSVNGIHTYPRSKPVKPYYPTRYSPYPSPSYSPTISYQTPASNQPPTQPYPTSTQPTVEETTYTQEATTVEPEVAVDEVIEISEYDQEVDKPSNPEEGELREEDAQMLQFTYKIRNKEEPTIYSSAPVYTYTPSTPVFSYTTSTPVFTYTPTTSPDDAKPRKYTFTLVDSDTEETRGEELQRFRRRPFTRLRRRMNPSFAPMMAAV